MHNFPTLLLENKYSLAVQNTVKSSTPSVKSESRTKKNIFNCAFVIQRVLSHVPTIINAYCRRQSTRRRLELYYIWRSSSMNDIKHFDKYMEQTTSNLNDEFYMLRCSWEEIWYNALVSFRTLVLSLWFFNITSRKTGKSRKILQRAN